MKLEIKKQFITGLIILLPLALTLGIVYFIINLFTQPFIGFFQIFLEDTSWYAAHRLLINFVLKILLLFFIFCLLVILGMLARLIFFNSLINFYDSVMHRIPIFKTVYKAIQQMTKALLGSSEITFKYVVLVPYPSSASWAIGLVSSPSPTLFEKASGEELISVYVSTTPNPTSGFLLMYKRKEVIYINMKIEDALKYIISCGVISTDKTDKPKTLG